jgi:hypothetical protein
MEVEEMMVPTFDLDSNGRRRDATDGYTAEITIVGTQQVQRRWLTPDGAQAPDRGDGHPH